IAALPNGAGARQRSLPGRADRICWRAVRKILGVRVTSDEFACMSLPARQSPDHSTRTVNSPLPQLRLCLAAMLLQIIAGRSGWSQEQEGTATMDIIRQLEAEQAAQIEARRKFPDFSPGDTVRVLVRVTEGSRTRIQA